MFEFKQPKLPGIEIGPQDFSHRLETKRGLADLSIRSYAKEDARFAKARQARHEEMDKELRSLVDGSS